MAAFLAAQHADIVFVQEANGYMGDLIEQLRGYSGFKDVVADSTTHILLRQGYFHPVTESWPWRFYSRATLANHSSDVLLLNLHLCEYGWDTGSDEEEYTYRGQFLQHILVYLQSLPNAPVIVGGDFNSFSHQDRSLYLPTHRRADNRVYTRLYQRKLFLTTILTHAGLVDCWRTCHPESRTVLQEQGQCFLSWPVPATAIEHDAFLPLEIASHEVAGRIDYLFVNTQVYVHSCVMMFTAKNWYSDHAAVVSRVSIPVGAKHFQASRLVRQPATVTPSFALRLRPPHTWLLSAAALSGTKNHYIEVVRLLARGLEISQGWFYVDGLQDCVDCSVAASRDYFYGTFNPYRVINARAARFEARLFNETQVELMRVPVAVEV